VDSRPVRICVLWSEGIFLTLTVPEVQFEHEPSRPGSGATYATAGARRSRLERFLDDLMIRTNESPYDINDANLHNSASSMVGDMASQNQNPESDSFAYMETLLESLAVLGRLGNALDILAQRVPAEIYTLVESSVEEAAERADFARRASILGTGDTVTSKLDAVASVLQSMSSASSALASDSVVAVGSLRGKDGFLRGSSLRLPALESASKLVDQETLRDLFWTIYSKLDAVAQGLRVISEVSNRIGSVSNISSASHRSAHK
jgi:exocyst complex component 4